MHSARNQHALITQSSCTQHALSMHAACMQHAVIMPPRCISMPRTKVSSGRRSSALQPRSARDAASASGQIPISTPRLPPETKASAMRRPSEEGAPDEGGNQHALGGHQHALSMHSPERRRRTELARQQNCL